MSTNMRHRAALEMSAATPLIARHQVLEVIDGYIIEPLINRHRGTPAGCLKPTHCMKTFVDFSLFERRGSFEDYHELPC